MKRGGKVFAAAFAELDVGPAEADYIDCHNEFVLLHSVAIAMPKGSSRGLPGRATCWMTSATTSF